MTDNESLRADQVIATLQDVLLSSENDNSRIAAAKILLDRIAPKEDDDARRREAEERDAALAEARGLLAEFAALKLAGLCQPGAVDRAGAAETTDAAGGVADLADLRGQGLGQDPVRG